ncbi:MAG: ankyrin repeat domain-containing protein, partial [Candidatus Margulisbacteria bacterium]|nr:ankyrin repeat domain-containing protein [Candidatus Margulisiibacteriota bacterium]
IWACYYQHKDVIHKLLQKEEIDVNALNKDKKSALYYAFWKDDPSIITALIRHKNINLEQINFDDKETLLMKSVKLKDVNLVIEVLGLPITDINAQDANKETAIMKVLERYEIYNEAVFNELLTHPGIDLNLKDKGGETVLMKAVKRCNLHTVEALLETPGIDTAIRNKDNQTAKSIAKTKDDKNILELFEKYELQQTIKKYREG